MMGQRGGERGPFCPVAPAAPSECVFLEGTWAAGCPIRGLLSPSKDLPACANKYGQGSPDLEVFEAAIMREKVVPPLMRLSSFELLEQVGAGGFGQIRLGRLKGERGRATLAVKEASRQEHMPCLTSEAQLHAQLRHPRIVPLLAILPYEQDPSLVTGLVTSFCEGGNLAEWLELRRGHSPGMLLGWSQRLRILEQVLQALEYCHYRGVTHLDMKPGNLLMRTCHPDTDPDILLCDFGLARVADGSYMPGRYRGTWPYMPPEMAVNSQTRAHPSLDMWSLGVVMLDLVSDHSTCGTMAEGEIKGALRAGTLYADLERLPGLHCEPEWLDLVRQCLQYDPAHRATASHLLRCVCAQRKMMEDRERSLAVYTTLVRESSMDSITSSGAYACATDGGSPRVALAPLRVQRPNTNVLNLPESLGLHPTKKSALMSPPLSTSFMSSVVEERSAQLGLPESLELYTARTSGEHAGERVDRRAESVEQSEMLAGKFQYSFLPDDLGLY